MKRCRTGRGWAVGVGDRSVAPDVGVDEFDGSGAGRSEERFATAFDDREGGDPVRAEQPGCSESSVSRPVPQMRMSPPLVCLSRRTSSMRSLPAMTTVGSHTAVSTVRCR